MKFQCISIHIESWYGIYDPIQCVLKGEGGMAEINIRIDDALKEKAELLFQELGLNMTTAINIFIRQAVREGRIPFKITTNVDSFFSEANMKVLKDSVKEANEGKFISRSIEDLNALEE